MFCTVELLQQVCLLITLYLLYVCVYLCVWLNTCVCAAFSCDMWYVCMDIYVYEHVCEGVYGVYMWVGMWVGV